MNPRRQLLASFWMMIGIQTIGSIDAPGSTPAHGGKPRKMPSPRRYAAVVILWSLYSLMSETSANAARLMARMAWITILAGAVLGPFGTSVINFLELAARRLSTVQVKPPTVSGTPTQQGGQQV